MHMQYNTPIWADKARREHVFYLYNTTMKTEPSLAIKELRRIIGRTQAEFAAMIGASKDTVASWETGRNKLSLKFARRIAFATGVDGDALLRGYNVLVFDHPVTWERNYTAEDFEAYRQTTRGRSDEAGARHHLKHCQDALELLFLAATKASGGKIRYRLPAVLDSFIEWCDQTREDFKLGQLIDEELTKRQFKAGLTLTYREWRRMKKEDPAALEAVGFKDDSRKPDEAELRLELKLRPGWTPGRSMHPPKPAEKIAVLES